MRIGNDYFHLLDIVLVSTPAQLKENSIIPPMSLS